MAAEDTWSLKKALCNPLGISLIIGVVIGSTAGQFLSKNAQAVVLVALMMAVVVLYALFRKIEE